MMISRWKIMAGMLTVSLGGLAAVAGQCPRCDSAKNDRNSRETVALAGPPAIPAAAPPASAAPPADPLVLPPTAPPSGPAKPMESSGLPGTPVLPYGPAPTGQVVPLTPSGFQDLMKDTKKAEAAVLPPAVFIPNTPMGTGIPLAGGDVTPPAPVAPGVSAPQISGPPPGVGLVEPPVTTIRPSVPAPPVEPAKTSQRLVPPTPVQPPVPVAVTPPAPMTPGAVIGSSFTGPLTGAAVVPASSLSTSQPKLRIVLRVGEGDPTFEVRSGDDLLLKVICEKVDITSPDKGAGLSAVKARGKVHFAGFGAEGTCEELAFLAGTGEVAMSGNVKIQVKDKLGRVESELTTENVKYRIDPSVISGILKP